MHRNIRGFHNEFSVPRFWSTGTAVDKSKHQHVCRRVPCLGRTHTHTHPRRNPASRAPADTPAAPRSPHSQHLHLSDAARMIGAVVALSEAIMRLNFLSPAMLTFLHSGLPWC